MLCLAVSPRLVLGEQEMTGFGRGQRSRAVLGVGLLPLPSGWLCKARVTGMAGFKPAAPGGMHPI